MPLIIISGQPSTGKSRVTQKIAEELQSKSTETKVEIISDELCATFSRAETYDDSHKERTHRGYIRSLVQQHVSNSTVVIVDSLNYIKGYRYELFCCAKLAETTHCVIAVECENSVSNLLNSNRPIGEQYSEEIMKALRFRYEHPDPSARWDSPLIKVINEGVDTEILIPMEEIEEAIFKSSTLQANRSTESAPIVSTVFLQRLNTVTNEIIHEIALQQKVGGNSNVIRISQANNEEDYEIILSSQLTMAQLSRIRRQFLQYTKQHSTVMDNEKIAALFVNFVQKNVQ